MLASTSFCHMNCLTTFTYWNSVLGAACSSLLGFHVYTQALLLSFRTINSKKFQMHSTYSKKYWKYCWWQNLRKNPSTHLPGNDLVPCPFLTWLRPCLLQPRFRKLKRIGTLQINSNRLRATRVRKQKQGLIFEAQAEGHFRKGNFVFKFRMCWAQPHFTLKWWGQDVTFRNEARTSHMRKLRANIARSLPKTKEQERSVSGCWRSLARCCKVKRLTAGSKPGPRSQNLPVLPRPWHPAWQMTNPAMTLSLCVTVVILFWCRMSQSCQHICSSQALGTAANIAGAGQVIVELLSKRAKNYILIHFDSCWFILIHFATF